MRSIPDTQREAYASIIDSLPDSRRVIWRVIAANEPISTQQICNKLGWAINCVSGRITELADLGLIRDSGRRGSNPSGRRCILWVTQAPQFDEKGQGLLL